MLIVRETHEIVNRVFGGYGLTGHRPGDMGDTTLVAERHKQSITLDRGGLGGCISQQLRVVVFEQFVTLNYLVFDKFSDRRSVVV